jgi:hypothetical protein
MKCPVVYANGHHCSGEIWQARAYGTNRDGMVAELNIRKIRLWCSENGDHAGVVPTSEGKERMEFYPDALERLGLYAEAVSLCENVELAKAGQSALPVTRPMPRLIVDNPRRVP